MISTEWEEPGGSVPLRTFYNIHHVTEWCRAVFDTDVPWWRVGWIRSLGSWGWISGVVLKILQLSLRIIWIRHGIVPWGGEEISERKSKFEPIGNSMNFNFLILLFDQWKRWGGMITNNGLTASIAVAIEFTGKYRSPSHQMSGIHPVCCSKCSRRKRIGVSLATWLKLMISQKNSVIRFITRTPRYKADVMGMFYSRSLHTWLLMCIEK